MATTTNGRLLGWGGAAALLAMAMLFTREASWTGSDVLVAGAMLLAVGGGIELAIRTWLGTTGRLMAVAAVLAASLLVWVEMAIGIDG